METIKLMILILLLGIVLGISAIFFTSSTPKVTPSPVIQDPSLSPTINPQQFNDQLLQQVKNHGPHPPQ